MLTPNLAQRVAAHAGHDPLRERGAVHRGRRVSGDQARSRAFRRSYGTVAPRALWGRRRKLIVTPPPAHRGLPEGLHFHQATASRAACSPEAPASRPFWSSSIELGCIRRARLDMPVGRLVSCKPTLPGWVRLRLCRPLGACPAGTVRPRTGPRTPDRQSSGPSGRSLAPGPATAGFPGLRPVA